MLPNCQIAVSWHVWRLGERQSLGLGRSGAVVGGWPIVKKDRLIFETQKALRDFINQGWEFGGQMSAAAMVADQGGMFAGAVSVSPGVYLYQLTETGLSASITIGGTKFFKEDELN